LALHNYESTYTMFPPGGVFNEQGTAFHGWATSISPYLEDSPFYNGVDFKKPWYDPDQLAYFQPSGYPGPPNCFLNPSISERNTGDGLAEAHYAGSDLIFSRNSSTRIADLLSGTSQTIMAGDAKGGFESFGSAYNRRDVSLGLNTDIKGFGSPVRDVTMM